MSVDAVIWTLLGQVENVIDNVTVANGYRTDIGAGVTRELPQLDTDLADEFGRVVLLVDGRIEMRTMSTQRRIREFMIFAEVQLNADETDAQARAHAALQDLIEAIPGKTRFTPVAGCDADVELAVAEILTRPEGMACIALRVEYQVVMQELLSP